MHKHMRGWLATAAMTCLLVPLLLGEGGDGCATTSMDPAPDMNGTWNIAYDDTMSVEINIGGAVYNEELAAAGGMISLTHDGTPLTFMLDCSLPAVVCPSEAWPSVFEASQRDSSFPHRVYATVTRPGCTGTLVDPDPSECGAGTLNPDCEQVCDGDVAPENVELYGEINVPGDRFSMIVGGGIATNQLNCALLSLSVAHADLENSGSAETGDWRVERLVNGEVVTGYAGGCIWIDDVDGDAALEAAAIGATVTVRTGFTGTR